MLQIPLYWPSVLRQCEKIRSRQGGCKTGEAVLTSGGKLNAKFIIHTVGPRWHGGNSNEDMLLKSAYLSSLKIALLHNIKTIAFPNISTGAYNFPKQRAAVIAIDTVKEFLANFDNPNKVVFVCFDVDNYNIYHHLLS
jgi:O-acetyl-ADP-ribose deacetylase (regulator of RNase III)